jgi:pimeloyl-ACP methyl ester carboxylesterase
MIRHMSAFLQAMAIEQADFAGASMGATMLLREAARPGCRFPIRRLVVASGGGFVPDNEERRRLLSYDGTPEAMRAILRANFHDPAWAQDDAYVKRRVEASLAPGAWEAIAAARLKPPTVPPRSDFGQPDTIAYERIPYPTLAMAGAEDKLRLPGYHEALGRIPDARIVVLAGAGHLLNIEKAGEFNDLVREFLLAGDAGG